MILRKNQLAFATFGVAAVLVLSGCSSFKLRKFEEGNLSQEIPKEIAEKFEVKDVAPGPTPEPAKKAEKKVEKKPVAPKITTKGAPIRRVEPMPFVIGEKLQYDIRYLGVTAGYLTFEVLPEKEVNSRTVYHLRGTAKSVKLFELVYRVNDVIESYWDWNSLYSHRFTMSLDESKQSRKSIELYDYEKNKSYIWNRIDHAEKGYSETKVEFDIPKWSQDILSALYYIRAADLPKAPGKEFRFSVIMDGKPWESVITFKEKAKIYAGKDYSANVYTLINYQDGHMKNRENTIWMSDDDKRYILRVETKVRVGAFAVALDKIL